MRVTRLDAAGKEMAGSGKKARRKADDAAAAVAAAAKGARSELTKSDAFFSHLQDVVDTDRAGGDTARRAKKAQEAMDSRPKTATYRL